MSEYKIAQWWEPTSNGKILCTLCPRYCKIGEGQHGFCYVRQNIDNTLYTIGYGRPIGFAVDPVEKKPLNHFLPGTGILSFGTAGCNLGCKFCQNWTSSKSKLDSVRAQTVTPEDIIEIAKKNNTPSIAFTYNDPTIIGEFVRDVSELANAENIRSVMVTAGYIDKEARKSVYKYIDAANVDLKAFTDKFYKKLTLSHLDDVLDTLLWLKHETDVWIELTTLLIPGQNDSEDEIKQEVEWVLNHLGDDVPIHFTAFHPDFKMTDLKPTPPATLEKARAIAIEQGLKYCYVGNVRNIEGQTTYCPECKEPLIKRDWHRVIIDTVKNGQCPNCGYQIEGIFK